MCPDTVFINATLFNVFTKEFVKGQSIWVENGKRMRKIPRKAER
jgi:hypothetical protein